MFADLIRAGHDRSFTDIGTDDSDATAGQPSSLLTSQVGLDLDDGTEVVVDGYSVMNANGIAVDPDGGGWTLVIQHPLRSAGRRCGRSALR